MNIEDRVSALERSNRRLRYVVGACLVATFGVFAMGQAASKPEIVDELRARSLAIYDKEGNERASLYVSDTYAPDTVVLALSNNYLSVDTAEEMMALPSINLLVGPDQATVKINGGGRKGIQLTAANIVHPDKEFETLANEPSLFVFDSEGKTAWSAP